MVYKMVLHYSYAARNPYNILITHLRAVPTCTTIHLASVRHRHNTILYKSKLAQKAKQIEFTKSRNDSDRIITYSVKMSTVKNLAQIGSIT